MYERNKMSRLEEKTLIFVTDTVTATTRLLGADPQEIYFVCTAEDTYCSCDIFCMFWFWRSFGLVCIGEIDSRCFGGYYWFIASS